jgi:hypothetical protein
MLQTNFELEAILVSEKWHKPYSLALMESNPIRLASLIHETENAIFTRYLELFVCPGPEEVYRDLRQATNTLAKLKESKPVAARQNSVVQMPARQKVDSSNMNRPQLAIA